MNGLPTSGKQRASRIPLDYYKHGDGMTRRKRAWTCLALGLTILWCLILIPAYLIPAVNKSPVGEQRYSHGPVCKAHATIGHECSACHVSFPMLGGRDALTNVLAGARSTFVGDKKCLECHLGGEKNDGAGAVHSTRMAVDMTPNCGTCHQDHKGVDKDLRRVADGNCTGCHKDVPAALAKDSGFKPPLGNVSGFPGDHPEFRSVKQSDPGKLRFNHAYHMTKGIVLTEGGVPFTANQMVAAGDGVLWANVVGRAGNNADARVQLDCTDCHRTSQRNERAWVGEPPMADASDEGKKKSEAAFAQRRAQRKMEDGVLLPAQTPGAYMAAINYDNHCAACHPTTISPGLPTIRHDRHFQPPELRKEVERIIAASGGLGPKAPAPFFPLPGKSQSEARTNVSAQADMAMHLLLEGKRTCGECHVDAGGGNLSVSSQKIAPANIPASWIKFARFDHGEHASRGIGCAECHPQAYKNSPADVLTCSAMPHKGAELVMLPQIDTCKQCHAPNPTKAPAGKYDCTECHTYHNGVGTRTATR